MLINQEFRELFWNLINKPYEAHWFHRVPSQEVLRGAPSDCSDRAYVLADYCEQNGIPHQFILTLFTQPELSLHVALVAEGFVYDPIWPVYEKSIPDYKKLLGGISLVLGSWIQKIIP